MAYKWTLYNREISYFYKYQHAWTYRAQYWAPGASCRSAYIVGVICIVFRTKQYYAIQWCILTVQINSWGW